jgi:serine phosphatase RsbU (regulator of sigma subunit)
LVYAHIDLATRAVRLVNAGHPAPFLMSPDGQTLEAIAPTGPVVGMIAEAIYGERELVLEAGATLVVVSDGVTEAVDADGDEFGDARLAGVLRAAAHEPPAVLCQQIIDAVRRHRGIGAVQDDLTVLVIRGAPL